MADDARAREEYTHPEKIYKNLVYAPTGLTQEIVSSNFDKGHIGYVTDETRKTELCWSCGWNVENQVFSDYGSRIRISHTRANLGIWEVGSRWMIRDEPNDATLGNDFVTQEFLRNQRPRLDIPLLKEMRRLSEPTDKVHITLMSRAQGKPLSEIWNTLTLDQFLDLKNQLGRAMKQWRQFKSLTPQTVDGRKLDDCLIGFCDRQRPPTCRKIGRTNDEWFKDIEKELRVGLAVRYPTFEGPPLPPKDPLQIEAELEELKKNFPKSEPYVLTHGDLNPSNIIVKDGKIEAIIDWEWSGYFPWWAERWMSERQGSGFSNMLWQDEDFNADPDIGYGTDYDTFHAEVSRNINAVAAEWSKSDYPSSVVQHLNDKAGWVRPPFCKCRPFTGFIKNSSIGVQAEHIFKEE